MLDVPFSPHRANRGLALPVRDDRGAVRFLEFGNTPLPEEVKDYRRERVKKRGVDEGCRPGYEMLLDDVYAVQGARLVGRPAR